MATWRVEAQRAIGQSLAPKTRMGYRRVIRRFEFFHKVSGYSASWPIPVEQLLHFGVSLWETGMAVESIRGQFSVIAFASKALGFA